MKIGKSWFALLLATILLLGSYWTPSVSKVEKVPQPLLDFAMEDVVVTDEYYANALALEVEYLKAFDADRLVSGFLTTKGLDKKANPYRGWESMEIRGHTLGHYLSAMKMPLLTPSCHHKILKLV